MKHTQGPWTVKTDDFNVVYIASEKESFIVADTFIDLSDNGLTQDEIDHAMADAELIASAPTMFDYIQYVEAKIDIDEMPMTYDQWKQAEIDMAD